MKRLTTVVLAIMVMVAAAATVYAVAVVEGAAEKEGGVKPIVHKSAYAGWRNGPSTDPDFFPIAVWLQSPRNAPQYKAIGINTYIGLWDGPTEKQLAELKKHDMKVICAQNEVGLRHKNDPMIVAWMHGDEPDNAQDMAKVWKDDARAANKAWPDVKPRTLKQWGKYGPPIPPSKIIADYKKIKKRDPTRPVILNLGQGVAWEGYHGRGVRSGHLEDYPQYIKGCDMVSFDIYPVVHNKPEVKGKLEFVPRGVDRLRKWSKGQKIVWNCIECTHISQPDALPTVEQIKSEVWMSLVHGSQGLIYFVHEFKPKFIEAGLLAHPEIAKGVGVINAQIHELAPALNSPTIDQGAIVKSFNSAAPVDIMVKSHGGATYLFAVGMRDVATKATFQVRGLRGKAVAEVIGEDRKIDVNGGKFTDEFKGYGVHLYKIIAGQ